MSKFSTVTIYLFESKDSSLIFHILFLTPKNQFFSGTYVPVT